MEENDWAPHYAWQRCQVWMQCRTMSEDLLILDMQGGTGVFLMEGLRLCEAVCVLGGKENNSDRGGS